MTWYKSAFDKETGRVSRLSMPEVVTLVESLSSMHQALGLKENDPKRSGTIRRCDLVGIGMALLEEVCHCGHGL